MAVNPKDVPLTREQVYDWVQQYLAMDEGTRPGLRTFIAGKVNHLELPDLMVNTQFHDDLQNETSLVEMILSDLPSYGIEI